MAQAIHCRHDLPGCLVDVGFTNVEVGNRPQALFAKGADVDPFVFQTVHQLHTQDVTIDQVKEDDVCFDISRVNRDMGMLAYLSCQPTSIVMIVAQTVNAKLSGRVAGEGAAPKAVSGGRRLEKENSGMAKRWAK